MTKQPKEQRFQLFLHELHDKTCEAAKANGRTLSSEVRHRVKQSFEQDDNAAKLAELRECLARINKCKPSATQRVVLDRIKAVLDEPHASQSAQKAE